MIKKLLLTLLITSASSIAMADACFDRAEQVRLKFVSVHDSLSEEDHLRLETVVGLAYGQCEMDPVAAETTLTEAETLLAAY